jgi:hypothetical protein
MTPEHLIITIIVLIWPACRAIRHLALLPLRVATDVERLRTERARLRARRNGYELNSAKLAVRRSELERHSGR